VKALAITGSVARGDASAASDVDLWVIGDRDAREQLDHPKADVTLLWQTPRRARAHDTLLRFEVDDAVVLHDPDGHLRAVRDAFTAQREAIRHEMLNDTALVIRDLIMNAQRQPAQRAIALLREAARRVAALRIYADHGWRVPRWRTFEAQLPRASLRRLRSLQGFGDDASWRALLRYLQAHDDELAPLRGRRAHYPPALPARERVVWLSRRGARNSALLLLRSALEDVSLGKMNAPAAVELWRRLHGFERRSPGGREVRQAAASCAKLVDELGVEHSIDPRWEIAADLRRGF
jgi:hypothetical protein